MSFTLLRNPYPTSKTAKIQQNAQQSPENHNCTHTDEVKLHNKPVTSTKP